MGFEDENLVSMVSKYKTSNINDIIIGRVVVGDNTDLVDTSLFLHNKMRICVEDIMDAFNNRSNRVVLRRLVEHGYSLIQEEQSKFVKRTRTIRRKYRGSDIILLSNATLEFKLNSLENQGTGERRTFALNPNFMGAMRDMSTVLMTSVANIERAAICYSLCTFDYEGQCIDMLPGKSFDFAKKERDKFSDACTQIYAFYEVFPKYEEVYLKMKKGEYDFESTEHHR